MPDGGMGQQLLGVAPQQLLPHLRLEVVEGLYSRAPLAATALAPLLTELQALLA